MFPVRFKSRIPCTESYPLKALEISAALKDTPQAEFLCIEFHRWVTMSNRQRDWRTIAIRYGRFPVTLCTSKIEIERGMLGPFWRIEVAPVPREQRHLIHGLLVDEGFPRIREWLRVREDVHGRFCREELRVLFSREKVALRYEEVS